MKKHYDERRVLIDLARKGAGIDLDKKQITVTDNQTIGIHSWGKIDFLVNYCGYHCTKQLISEIKAEKEAQIAEYKAAKKKAKAEAKAAALEKVKKSNNNLIKSGVMKATKLMKKLIKR